ncbi:MAG: DUF2059 domain-containing protein [Planctomycetota bacterium]|jgi:hypothetical protein
MVRIFSWCVVFVFLIFTNSITLAEENKKNVNKLLDLSGITKQIGEFPTLIKSGMEQSREQGTPIPESIYQSMLMAIDDSIDTRTMVKGVANELLNNLNKEEIKFLMTWYESELGRKITLLEEKSSTPAAYQEMMLITESLLADSNHVSFAKKLDELVGATDFSMKLQENTQIAVLSSVFKALNPHKKFDLNALKSQMSKQRTQIRANINQIVIVSFTYTYRNLNQEEIHEYTEFLESPTAKIFNESAMNGIDKEMNKALIQLGKSMEIILQSNVKQG